MSQPIEVILLNIAPSGDRASGHAFIDAHTGRVTPAPDAPLGMTGDLYAVFEDEHFLVDQVENFLQLAPEDFGEFRSVVND